MDGLQAGKNPLVDRDISIFKNCLPLQIHLHELTRVLGKTDTLNCLDIGLENGMMAYHLRKVGGKWHSAVSSQQTAARIAAFVETNVEVLEGHTLPFKKKVFDLVVVAGMLEKMESDEDFIEECHRILQPNGRLVISVPHRKSWTPIFPLRRLLGVTPSRLGWMRAGYTESMLFSILKHGFDVHHLRSYSRFFVELTDTVVKSAELRIQAREPGVEGDAAIRRLYMLAGPFYRVAYQLDLLFFLSRGFSLIATAKRRAWRPRNAPVLADGRSISEAVLTRPAE